MIIHRYGTIKGSRKKGGHQQQQEERGGIDLNGKGVIIGLGPIWQANLRVVAVSSINAIVEKHCHLPSSKHGSNNNKSFQRFLTPFANKIYPPTERMLMPSKLESCCCCCGSQT
jgi:hypothetical protein